MCGILQDNQEASIFMLTAGNMFYFHLRPENDLPLLTLTPVTTVLPTRKAFSKSAFAFQNPPVGRKQKYVFL